MKIYPLFFRLVFSSMDPERAHEIGFSLIKFSSNLGLGPLLRRLCVADASQQVERMGITFPSPFGLAAGFDKLGAGVVALSNLGFGHIEIGTITAQPQPGNPKPRLFRLPEDGAIINRMGFNNDGASAAAARIAPLRQRLERVHRGARPVVGVNIGKTKTVPLEEAVEDYRESARLLAPHADYMVVNVSSPNTPGLRLLQSVESLGPILQAVREESTKACGRRVPLLVKIAPDLADEDILEVAELVKALDLEGVVATNTTISRQGLRSNREVIEKAGAGGLSGDPLRLRSLEVLKLLSKNLQGHHTIISVGGVRSGKDVRERLEAGAHLVQAYTAFLYEGPFWVRSIHRALRKKRS